MLDGIRILDLSEEPGFLAGKMLGDLGADVVKVEPPGGDGFGRRGPYLGDVADSERSLRWLALNTSKRGITLALEMPRGRELFRSLAERFDVVLETAAPGALEALGVGWDVLHIEQPGLVWCSLTPFGRTGPYAGFRARDLVLVAMGGNAALTGDADRAPVRCTLPTSYYAAGPDAAAGIAMALYARERSGRGRLVDVSMQESQLATLVTSPGQYSLSHQLRGRTGARLGGTREIWQAKDGDVTFGLRGGAARIPSLLATVAWMAEAAMAPAWLLEIDWKTYNHHLLSAKEIARLEGAFSAFFATKTRRELFEQALVRRIMLAPCNDSREILEQPQLRSRGLFTTLDYPEFGAKIEHPDFFAKSSRGRIGIRRRAPRVGEHNAEIYGELGIDADALRELADQGVI